MTATRRTDDVIWWLCIVLTAWPVIVLPARESDLSATAIAALVLIGAVTVGLALGVRWVWWLALLFSAIALLPVGGYVWWALVLNVVHLALLLTSAVRRRLFGVGPQFPAVRR